jgi:RNA-splicing ligase RtcB
MIELKGKYNKDCKIFADDIEESAYSLIQNILDEKATKDVPVRIMPDVHTGVGIVIGFTCPMTKFVNPDWIGVDIGCGVETHELSLSDDINLELIDSQIRDVIPMGMNLRSKSILNEKEFTKKFKRNVSSFHSKYTEHTGVNYELPIINEKYITSTLKRLHMEPEVFYKSIGTLGGGNHLHSK